MDQCLIMILGTLHFWPITVDQLFTDQLLQVPEKAPEEAPPQKVTWGLTRLKTQAAKASGLTRHSAWVFKFLGNISNVSERYTVIRYDFAALFSQKIPWQQYERRKGLRISKCFTHIAHATWTCWGSAWIHHTVRNQRHHCHVGDPWWRPFTYLLDYTIPSICIDHDRTLAINLVAANRGVWHGSNVGSWSSRPDAKSTRIPSF